MFVFTYCNLGTSFLILVRNKIKSRKIQRAKARRTDDNRTSQRREIETGEKFIDRGRKIQNKRKGILLS